MADQDLLGEEEPRVVVRDKRRIDPDSGEVRPVDHTGDHIGDHIGDRDGGDAVPVEGDRAAELLADLQRVKAEFDNYRKRVDRDRLAVVEQAAARVVTELLPVLDDIERARAHGEVEGGFKTVADNLDAVLSRLGVERFGAAGDEFDPTRHEAVMHAHSADVTTSTCVEVMRAGYAFAGRLMRPAMVAVADPAAAADPESPTEPNSAAASVE